MAFQRKRKLYKIDFTGTDLEGLKMVMLGMTVEESLQLGKLRSLAKATDEEQKNGLLELFDFVAGKVHEWDMVDDAGQPVTPTGKEFLTWDVADAFAVLDKWSERVEGVGAPLEQKSSGGSTFKAPSIPMDIPSPNLQS